MKIVITKRLIFGKFQHFEFSKLHRPIPAITCANTFLSDLAYLKTKE